ncbi:hypothetical protein [Legionella fallonii]|uniref:Uncharacterized protein n=1 Tax=Legionella fallonii LLAP-10 TaxID=1212491 RepID=A0A098G5P2_9GAMM|nr:hypothetical protein [Legionella fallonii]CEG57291.1 protein of unknown function [Legionella fallonii LLAP-10]
MTLALPYRPFTPRKINNDPEWYIDAIESKDSRDNLGNIDEEGGRFGTGIDQNKAVCFIVHPTVAPFFPTSLRPYGYSYIYIMVPNQL